MKSFACGHVFPGCRGAWVCPSESEILVEVAKHAAGAHGLACLPSELAEQVRRHVVEVAERV